MTEHETTFGGLAARFLGAAARLEVTTHIGLEHVAKHIEATAKEEIGTYQSAIGAFPAWAPLTESTKDDRVRQGFSEDEPLLRTGDLRDSISHEVRGHEAAIGSTSDIAVYQELGTGRIPPRPFLGPASVRSVPLVIETLGAAVVAGMRGTEALPAAYDMAICAEAEVTRR
jgi:phage gpG-like protein